MESHRSGARGRIASAKRSDVSQSGPKAYRDVAVVTGGSAGIGAEICKEMLEADYEVISLDVRPPDRTHKHFHFVEIDLLDERALCQVSAEVSSRFAVTHVIHNAGSVLPALLGDLKEIELHSLTQIHLGAAITLVQAALPHMKSINFGRIVLMSSRGALGAPGRSTYSATKSGVIGMARTWALELAACGITVNVVAPGPIEGTKMFRGLVPQGSDREAALKEAIPVRRLGRADDVARAVMFFADRANSFVTGQTLYVCGGSSVGTVHV